MKKQHSIKISHEGYKAIEELLYFFKKRYGFKNFTKTGILENSLRIYSDYVKQTCLSQKDDNSTPQEH